MWKAWVTLLLAGIFEIIFAVSLPRTAGFTRLLPTLFTLVAMAISFTLLNRSLRELPIGTAYAVWVGIGAAGTAAYGMIFAGEPSGALRIGCLLLIMIGTVGLKFAHG